MPALPAPSSLDEETQNRNKLKRAQFVLAIRTAGTTAQSLPVKKIPIRVIAQNENVQKTSDKQAEDKKDCVK